MKLTKRTIEALPFPESHIKKTQYLVFDDNLKGLGVRVTPTLKKSFFLAYSYHGQVKRITLGSFPILSLTHARELANKNLALVANDTDPAEVKKKKRSKAINIEDLYNSYFELHIRNNRNERGQHSVKGDFDLYILPMIGKKTLDSITRQTINGLLKPLKDRPRTHNICRSYLKTMFLFGEREGLIQKSPMVDIEKLPEQSREEWVKVGDLKKLAKEIRSDPNVNLRKYYFLLMLTACRKNELQKMKWEQIDIENQVWTIPQTKNGTRHEVHLVQTAINLLNEIPHLKDNPYVFVGQREGQSFHDTGKTWRRIRKRAELEKYTIHDIRRTMASYLAQDGVSRDRIAQILNHKDQSTTGIYARLTHNDKVQTFERLAEILKEKEVFND
jgi:integrase